ncbi:peptidoglycan-binding protein [Streptomyces collinus]|uniref:peptidoglycan-binding protein n=1 Tax=Streptomyces collinus TaxID=42684 RepID=UPI0033A10852
MAVMPGAQFRPVPNKTTGGMRGYYGVVLHTMQGTLWGSDAWFRNPKAQASSHFGVGKDGTILQWVDTVDRAWAEAAGNPYWISIEHEGKSGDSLTQAQIDADAKILAWVHKTHDVQLKSTDSVSGRGLGWHGMGGADWGGHTACPGTPVKNQRAAILKATEALLGADTGGTSSASTYTVKKGDTLSSIAKAHGTTVAVLLSLNKLKDADDLAVGQKLKLPAKKPAAPQYEPFPGSAFFHGGRHSPIVTAMGRRLVAEGCGHYNAGPGPDWTNADRESYRAWQKKYSKANKLGWTDADCDGIPGKSSWDALKVPKV